LIKQVRSAENLSVINVPLVARALVSGVAWCGGKVVRAILAEGECALDRAEHVALLSPAVRGDLSAGGEGGNGRLLLLPVRPWRGLAEVALYSVADGWPLDVAKHVDEI
jgi:hypothetical protein